MARAAGRLRVSLFGTLLFVSGFCGISYEVLYARILGNLIGDQFVVSASILLTFLLGIGCGSLYAHRLWRFLWLLEAAIGAYGISFALGAGALDRALFAAASPSLTSIGPAMLFCVVLLVVPAFMVGCSLPLFAGYLGRLLPGRVFSAAYAVYNLGAALTVLLIEFALFRLLGLRATTLVVASLNLAVSLALLCGYRGLGRIRPDPLTASRFPKSHLMALAVASIASAVFQLLMVKTAECILGPFRETFALVLSLILFGIAVGTWATRRLRLDFAALLSLAILGLVWFLAALEPVVEIYASLYPAAARSHGLLVVHKWVLLASLMGIPALCFGATIPALLVRQDNVARESGQLLFVSSLANAAGFVLMACVLHRYLDYGLIVLTIAGLAAVGLAVYARREWRGAPAAALLLLGAVAAHGLAWNEDLLYLGHFSFRSPEQMRGTRQTLDFPEKYKGFQDVFSINYIRGRPFFFINGYVSMPLDAPYEKLVGAFASLFAPRRDRALVLGLGSGATAGAVALLFEQADGVEINPVVVDNLFRMAEFNYDLESLPNVNVFTDDAMHYVKSSRDRYSLVINTVTTPLYFSSSKLYALDFLEAVRNRLTEDGVYVTWMDGRVGDRGADIILNTLRRVFRHCALGIVRGQYYLLLCSGRELAIADPAIVARNPVLRQDFYLRHGLVPEWLHFGLLTHGAYEVIRDREGRINTLDAPALEFEMARLATTEVPGFEARVVGAVTLLGNRQCLPAGEEWDPVSAALHAELLLGDHPVTDRRDRLGRERIEGYGRRRAEAERLFYADHAADVDSAEAYDDYGLVLLEQEDHAGALEAFLKALARNPELPYGDYKIGRCLEALGRPLEALDRYDRALAGMPDDEHVLRARARVQLHLRRFDAAMDTLRRPGLAEDAETLYLRGLALSGQGRVLEAVSSFRAAVKEDPSHVGARWELVRLSAGVEP